MLAFFATALHLHDPHKYNEMVKKLIHMLRMLQSRRQQLPSIPIQRAIPLNKVVGPAVRVRADGIAVKIAARVGLQRLLLAA